eukprot:COSAG05_NODE_2195_length_3413_cov_24.923959_2_plen_99_part_00
MNLDLRLWMKALSDILPAGAILPAQVLAITEGPNAADQKAQYQELKDLVMKTYTSADALEQMQLAPTQPGRSPLAVILVVVHWHGRFACVYILFYFYV